MGWCIQKFKLLYWYVHEYVKQRGILFFCYFGRIDRCFNGLKCTNGGNLLRGFVVECLWFLQKYKVRNMSTNDPARSQRD